MATVGNCWGHSALTIVTMIKYLEKVRLHSMIQDTICTPTQALDFMTSHYRVSRETWSKMLVYEQQLQKWQRAMNLVSKNTLSHVWVRHFIDSAQLLSYIPDGARKIVDMGSGGGFPAMVLAMTGQFEVHFIESDRKKIEFLRNVSRETKTPVHLHCCRLESFKTESLKSITADLVTSRALAPLDKLLGFAQPFAHQETQCLFLKGATHTQEIACTKRKWDVKFSVYPSITDSNGAIIQVENIKNARKPFAKS